MGSKLNKKQQEAISYTKGPLLIVAGAGTGKTTVISHKVAHLIQSGEAKPEEILALTFTENAAFEMRERIDAMLETGYVDIEVSTFHAFCQRVLEQYGLDIGIPNYSRLLTQTDAWLLVKKHLYSFNLDYYRPIGNPTAHIHSLIQHFQKCKDELISPAEYLEYAEGLALDTDDVHTDEKTRLTELANAYHTYTQLLLDQNALDFGDLIFYVVKLLRERPNILASLQKQYPFILVDEFQDVNWAQYVLVQMLASGEKGQLTVVGDDDQSIYAFRGASVSNILRFKEDFEGAEEIVLTENYRSGQEILDASYTSIQHNNPDRLEPKLSIDKKLIASGSVTESKVKYLHAQSLEGEVALVVKEIEQMKKQEGVRWDDIALLVRANNHAEPFMQAFDRAGLPYEFLSSQGLYKQQVVGDCVNFLRLVIDSRDNNALYRLLTLPYIDIDEYQVQQLGHYARRKSISLFATLGRASEIQLQPEGIRACESARTWIQHATHKSTTKKTTEVLYSFLEESGYLTYLEHGEQKGNAELIRQIHYLRQFFDYIEQYEVTTGEHHVRSFLDYFESVLESGETGTLAQPVDTPDSINIMTIHGSKGLEYRYVFVVNMIEGRFPSRRRGDPMPIPDALIHELLPEGDAHYQEERRLFYVATTRAKEKLYFTGAEYYSEKRKAKPSRFLDELSLDTHTAAPVGKLVTSLKPAPKKRASRAVYELPKTFSISQIHLFQKSPYQYKLEHILKIPQRGSPYFSFGNSMHLTLQKFYTAVKSMNEATQGSLFDAPLEEEKTDDLKAPSLKEMLVMYDESWIEDWYDSEEQREQYYARGKEMLTNFFAHHNGTWRVPVALEGGFSVKMGNHTIRGKIDRIDVQEDGTLEIIDYKSGKPKEKVAGTDKDQLLLYQIAAETLPQYRHIGKIGKLTYYYLDNDSTVSFLGTEKEKEKFTQSVIQTIDQILQTDWSTVTRDDVGFFDKKTI